jgi:flagellar basal-body rod protein FlgB
MFFADVVNRESIPAMDKMLAFTQARHRVLTENIANADTPGYRTKQLDAKAFQAALAEAMDSRRPGSAEPLKISGGDQWRMDRDGQLVVTPTTDPSENVLFHDGTNLRIERQMALLAENAMMHQAVTEMLRGKYEGLLKAIRGTV